MGDLEIKEEGSLRFLYMEQAGYPFEHERMAKEVDAYIAKMNLKPYGPRMIMVFNEPDAAPLDRWQTAVGRGIIGLLETTDPFALRDFSGLISLGAVHEGTIEELAATYQHLKDRATEEGRSVQPFWRIVFKRNRGEEGTLVPKTLVQLFVGKCG